MKDKVYELARKFSQSVHGNTDYDKDEIFVMGESESEFVPLTHLQKHLQKDLDIKSLQGVGFSFTSYDFLEGPAFAKWFEKQFSKKLTVKHHKHASILYFPEQSEVMDAIEGVNRFYEILRSQYIIINGKNFPTQLGEWYIKNIFGLKQVKSTSQRGFDFVLADKTVEVKVHWNDKSSPKGVKLKKSLLELSDFCILVYISRNFTIRDICFLDSAYVLRKFPTKGHTIFLKDVDLAPYFFSKSSKHYDKIMNKACLLKFASPQLAIKIDEKMNAQPST